MFFWLALSTDQGMEIFDPLGMIPAPGGCVPAPRVASLPPGHSRRDVPWLKSVDPGPIASFEPLVPLAMILLATLSFSLACAAAADADADKV